MSAEYDALKVTAYVTLKQEYRQNVGGAGFSAWSTSGEDTYGPFDVGDGITPVPLITVQNYDGTGSYGQFESQYRFTWIFENHFLPTEFTVAQTTNYDDLGDTPSLDDTFTVDVKTNPFVYELVASIGTDRNLNSIASFRCPS